VIAVHQEAEMGEEIDTYGRMCDVGHHETQLKSRPSPRLSLRGSHPYVGIVVPLGEQRS
jgi:hypothetical protein